MKISELLNKLFPNMDDEIDLTEKTASNLNDSGSEKIVDDDVNKDIDKDVKNNVEKEDEVVKIPTFKDGLFDLDSTDNVELRAVLEYANNWHTEQANTALINKAVDDKVNTLKLHKGITKDAVITLLDKSNIKVKDGKVTGIDEAFEALKTAQAGLFVSSKENQNTPIMEGFNPARGSATQVVPNSFVEAFSMTDNI